MLITDRIGLAAGLHTPARLPDPRRCHALRRVIPNV